MLSIFKQANPLSFTSRAFFSTSFIVTKQAKKPAEPAKKTPKKKAPTIKRPLTPYNAFTSDAYKENGDALKAMPFGERAAHLAQEWKSLASRDLERFTAIAEKDRQRYLQEKETEAKNKPPKRPLTSYALFFNQIRSDLVAQNPSASFGDLGKLGGQKWKALSDSEKAPFQELYAKNKAEYVKAVEAHKSA